jgi:hypothetical protein
MSRHGDQDWAYFLDQALRQRVLSLAGRNIVRYRLWQPTGRGARIPEWWLYSAAYEALAQRNRTLFTEFGRVLRALTRRGVRHAVRKGPAVCVDVYEDPGVRWMNDLDLLIERDAFPAVGDVLAELGYAQGSLDPNGAAIVAPDRSTRLFWSMHLNNALPYRRPATDTLVDTYNVDLCFDLFQRRSAGGVDVSLVLDRATPRRICGEDSFMLHPVDHLVDLCLHLYKEATSYLSIERGNDINLMRFLDVAETVRASAPETLARLPSDAAEMGAERELYYALHHTRLLYADAIPAGLVDRLQPVDVGFLDEYGALEGRTGRWRHEFLDRLFDPDRRFELDGPSTVPRG